MEKTLNQRLLELVNDYGGPSKMADALGLATPQIFYNLKNRPTSQPNSETISKVFSLVPLANANWLYKGVGSKYLKPDQEETGTDAPMINQTQPAVCVEVELARLKLENDYLRRMRDRSDEEKAKYWKMLESMHDRQLDFSGVSNQSTGMLFDLPLPCYAPTIGFQWYQVTGEKIPVNVTKLFERISAKQAVTA